MIKKCMSQINMYLRFPCPPGYIDVNYLYKNKNTGIPIISNNKYCKEILCYPLLGWKYSGHPMCKGYTNSK